MFCFKNQKNLYTSDCPQSVKMLLLKIQIISYITIIIIIIIIIITTKILVSWYFSGASGWIVKICMAFGSWREDRSRMTWHELIF